MNAMLNAVVIVSMMFRQALERIVARSFHNVHEERAVKEIERYSVMEYVNKYWNICKMGDRFVGMYSGSYWPYRKEYIDRWVSVMYNGYCAAVVMPYLNDTYGGRLMYTAENTHKRGNHDFSDLEFTGFLSDVISDMLARTDILELKRTESEPILYHHGGTLLKTYTRVDENLGWRTFGTCTQLQDEGNIVQQIKINEQEAAILLGMKADLLYHCPENTYVVCSIDKNRIAWAVGRMGYAWYKFVVNMTNTYHKMEWLNTPRNS